MHTGAFAPFPLRLGNGNSPTAAEFCRLANDAAALARTAPIAVVRTSLGAPNRSVEDYIGRNGAGMAYAPTATYVSSGTRLVWPATYLDEFGVRRRWHVSHLRVHPLHQDGASPTLVSCGEGLVESPVQVWGKATVAGSSSALDARLEFIVYGTTDIDPEDYGGDLDKEDCETELIPYAAQAYRLIQGAQGSAISQELSGLVHADNLARARRHGWGFRLAEKLSCELNPGTADCHLDDWCQLLSVDTRSTDTKAARRRRAAAAYTVLAGATPPIVDAAVEKLLGRWFVRCWRNWNDSMTPATMTYWPTVNPGPSQWDIGGGCWTSEHAHLVIEVKEPSDSERGEFLTLVNQDLSRLLDRLLPSHMTWSWCTNLDEGFRLDLGSLDYEALGS